MVGTPERGGGSCPKAPATPLTAEQVVDSTLFIYGFGGGRTTLNQIRKTTFEKGKTTLIGADGKIDLVSYQRWIIRADSLAKEKIRIDQEFASARYALVFNGEKVYGIYNNNVFNPREDAVRAFENTIFHGVEALFLAEIMVPKPARRAASRAAKVSLSVPA